MTDHTGRMTLGIIDVGTNSIHLLLGLLNSKGQFRVIRKQQDVTRIGEGGLARSRLTRRAIGRAMKVLQRYAAIMQRHRVDYVEAVATSAVREAANGRAFVRRVRRELGIPLRVISGRTEARLIYFGVIQGCRVHRPALVLTIGGGSAQVIHGDGLRIRATSSVLLGCARLSQRFIRHDPPTNQELQALKAHVRQVWAPVVRMIRRRRWKLVLGSSATLHQLLLAAYIRHHGHRPTAEAALTISQSQLRRMAGWLARWRAADRRTLEGVDEQRESLVLPTAEVLLAWMEGCKISTIRWAPGSLREGLVVEARAIKHRAQDCSP